MIAILLCNKISDISNHWNVLEPGRVSVSWKTGIIYIDCVLLDKNNPMVIVDVLNLSCCDSRLKWWCRPATEEQDASSLDTVLSCRGEGDPQIQIFLVFINVILRFSISLNICGESDHVPVTALDIFKVNNIGADTLPGVDLGFSKGCKKCCIVVTSKVGLKSWKRHDVGVDVVNEEFDRSRGANYKIATQSRDEDSARSLM